MLIKEIRLKTKLTQKEFAERFQIPLSTLRKWEQGESKPSKYLLNFLISASPEYNDELRAIKRKDRIYYINEQAKIIYDKYGNSIKYKEDLKDVSENNLSVYVDNFFKQFYDLQKLLNEDIKYDLPTAVWGDLDDDK